MQAADDYREPSHAHVVKARADFTIVERLVTEARQRFGVDIELPGEDE